MGSWEGKCSICNKDDWIRYSCEECGQDICEDCRQDCEECEYCEIDSVEDVKV
jgi:hypothetical protein